MKQMLVIMLTCVLMCGCRGKNSELQRQAVMDASKQELAAALAERDQLLALVTEMSATMEQIKHLENILTLAEENPEDKSIRRSQMLADIKLIRNTIQQRRKRLAELESELEQSTLYTDELKSTIRALRRQLDSQMAQIETFREQLATANRRIDSLSSAVDSLSTTVMVTAGERNAARETSRILSDSLNMCYYVAATLSAMKEHKIIEGGFLRKSKLLKGGFDKGFFTTADKRTLDSIPLHTRKVRIHTTHPEESYRITDGDDGKTLLITDPNGFWSLSNYLVIQID